MIENRNKVYDLEDRTLEFSKNVIRLCKKLTKDQINKNLVDQIVRSSASVGANYREAGESLSKKDFVYRIKITRKECKETTYWLQLVKEANPDHQMEADRLSQESKELRNIFTAILNKSQ